MENLPGILVALGLLAILCLLTIGTTLIYDKILDMEEKINMKIFGRPDGIDGYYYDFMEFILYINQIAYLAAKQKTL